MEEIRACVQIEGIVQGVGFRPFGCEHFQIETGQEGEERLGLISPDIATASKVGILLDEQEIGMRFSRNR